jgi:transposase
MRYELTDFEWSAIRLMLPNKPRGVPRVDDRRVLNGIFWVLRSGAPWRDLPGSFGPYTTCYNRFVRWRRAGIWDRIMDTLTTAHDAAVQMIDTSIVRVHQQGACIAGNKKQLMGRSRGGLTSKIHVVVEITGLPVRLALSTGEAHDNRLCSALLSGLKPGTMLLGRALINAQPDSNCCQLDEGEIVGCEFVVASRNPTTLLDLIKEPFDQITSTVEVRAEADRPLAIPFWRNVGPRATLPDKCPDPVGIVSTIR